MFEDLSILPPDSILGLAAACRADSNPDKIDLTIGIYMGESGVCPVFEAVKKAQRRLIEEEQTKAYIPAGGDPDFLRGLPDLVIGKERMMARADQVAVIQAPGGCGALRIGAEVIQAAMPGAKVWVSDPTWPVHLPLLGSVGLHFETYRYYDPTTHTVKFDAMVDDLKRAERGDIVLLHGCCHNPSGADLSLEQWQVVAEMAAKQGFTPFVDLAYQGLGDGLEADVVGLRTLIDAVPEVVIAASCSKNMGLYRERTGMAIFVCASARAAQAADSQAKSAARRVYSMPPAHGAIIAGKILGDAGLRHEWEQELEAMCQRINMLRVTFKDKLELTTGRDFGFIAREKGMFSFLGLSKEQAQQVRAQRSLYMLDSSRINVASLNASNIDRVVAAVASVL